MSNAPLTFLTGASGFVGAAVARILAAEGHHLRLLVRPSSKLRNLEGLTNYELVKGDLADPASYREALRGCDYLFHVAADYRIWVPDAAEMHKINVDGTRQLMEAALEAKIQKIVYTSSVATLGHYNDSTPANEETPVAFEDMIGVYKKSKFMAEQEVRRLIKQHALPCVIVHPSTPIGPRDIKPTPTGRVILEAAMGRMPAYVDTGLNVAHVDDVAEGHLLALRSGKIGENYILGGENLALSTILGIVAKKVGRKPPCVKLPQSILFPLAYLVEAWAKRTKQEPMLTLDGLRMSKRKMFFSSEKAKRELGYAPRAAEAAILDAIDWFRMNNYC